MLTWITEGDHVLAILDEGRRPVAGIRKRADGRWELKFTVPRLSDYRILAKKRETLQRWVNRYARTREEYLRKVTPFPSDPYAIPKDMEEYFYDAIWNGYRSTARKDRY